MRSIIKREKNRNRNSFFLNQSKNLLGFFNWLRATKNKKEVMLWEITQEESLSKELEKPLL